MTSSQVLDLLSEIKSFEDERVHVCQFEDRHFEEGSGLIDESGQFLNFVVRRRWSLIGQTPVLDGDGGHRHKVSVIGGISVSPAAQRLGLYFATEPNEFFTADKVVPFQRDLLKHLRGNVIVVWDRGGNHKGWSSGSSSAPGVQ